MAPRRHLAPQAHERVGAVVDAWALHVTGESPDIIGTIPAGKLVEVRLSDAPRETPGASLTHQQRLMPGETGAINAAAILSQANAAPMLLLTGTADTTVKPRNSRALAAAQSRNGAKAATLYYDELSHSGIVMAFARPYRGLAPVIDDLDAFFDGVR